MEGPILGLITRGSLSAHRLLWQEQGRHQQDLSLPWSRLLLPSLPSFPQGKQNPGRVGLADVSVLKRKPELPRRGSTAEVTPAWNDSCPRSEPCQPALLQSGHHCSWAQLAPALRTSFTGTTTHITDKQPQRAEPRLKQPTFVRSGPGGGGGFHGPRCPAWPPTARRVPGLPGYSRCHLTKLQRRYHLVRPSKRHEQRPRGMWEGLRTRSDYSAWLVSPRRAYSGEFLENH